MFKVLLVVSAVVIIAILAVFFSLASLIVLASVLTAFVLCKVYREVNRQLSTCKITC